MFASGLLINIQGVFIASLDNTHSTFSFMAFNFSFLLEVEQISCCSSHQGHRTIDRHALPPLCWKNMYLASFRFPFSRLNKSNGFTFSSHAVVTSSSHFHSYSPGVFQSVWTLYFYRTFSQGAAAAEIHRISEVCGSPLFSEKRKKWVLTSRQFWSLTPRNHP